MKNAFLKDSLRQVRVTLNRFGSILAITALGVAFYAGLKATAPDMRRTAERFFDQLNFMDLQLVSTAGFTQEDADAVKAVGGVKDVMPAYSADALVPVSDSSVNVKLLSSENGPNAVDRPELLSGRMPRTDSEILADPRFLKLSGKKTGDKLTLRSGTGGSMAGTLKQDTYTIVGVAQSPLYISYERGSSSIGNGRADAYLLLRPGAFTTGVYTELYLTADNTAGLSRFDKEYDHRVKTVSDALDRISAPREAARYTQMKTEGRKKLDDARQKLSDSQKALDDAAAQLAASQKQIEDGRSQLERGKAQLNAQLKSAQDRLDASRRELSQGEADYQANLKAYNDGLLQYDTVLSQLQQAKENLPLLTAQLSQVPPGSDDYRQIQEQITACRQVIAQEPAIEAQGQVLAQSEQQLDAARAALDQSQAQLAAGTQQLNAQRTQGENELAEKEKELASAQQTLNAARSSFDAQKAAAQPQFDAARRQIAEGETALSQLKKPVLYILDRNANAGFVGFEQDADRIDAIANVFPLIFFLVAALVSLTTMTRLVEDDRTYIGTMKAIGYGKGVIAAKYLLYAAAASLLGSVIGLGIGYNLFPRVVFNAYRILYSLPGVVVAFHIPYAIVSSAAAVFCAAVPAWLVCVGSLRNVPAELMRPKVPQAGRRILLERFGPVWKRMNFSQKVAARNLFRYKKRLIMTIAGVAGCTALIFTGFGLRDAISTIVSRQYGEIRVYDMEIDLKENAAASQLKELENTLSAGGVTKTVRIRQQAADVLKGSGVRSVSLVVPENPSELAGTINLRQRGSHASLKLDDSTVIISEKLASLDSLKKGDRMKIRSSDGTVKTVTVGGITENYVYHYVFLSPKLYQKLYGESFQANQLLCGLKDTSKSGEDRISGKLMKLSLVSAVSFTTHLRENFSKMIGALRYVVLVLIVSAALLAFVVLFSLTSINIDERARELATIKVLGFFDGEMAAYVYRENVVLTLLGALIGLGLGIWMERFVIVTAEVDLVMFSRDILWQTYLYSAGLTVLFAAFVNLLMFSRIRKIDMVSSLKSME